MSDLRVIDGSKYADFDGFVLEVSGLSGTTSVERIAINAIEKVGVVRSGDELMFMVKTPKGGFGLAGSLEKMAEWEALTSAVDAAIVELKASQS